MRPSPPSCITRVEVTTLSRKSRSWLTSSRVPGWSASSSSSSSSVSMSRSLVGSSITSRLDGCANSLASSSRLRSPPDSRVIGARAFGGEQEVLQIADHVLALAADLDELQPLGDVFQRVPVLAQRRAVLVEVGHLQLGADADLAGLRLQVAQQQLEQGGLAAAVGADQADAVAAQDGRGKVAHQCTIAERERHVLRLDDLLSRGAGLRGVHAHVADLFAPLRALHAHRLEPAHAAFVAGAAGLDALADPDFLLRQHLVETRVLLRLGVEPFFLAAQVVVPVAWPAGHLAAVDLDDARGQRAQEAAV